MMLDYTAFNKGNVNLPVKCILDTRTKPHYGEYDKSSVKVDSYNLEEMPAWTKFLKYQQHPSEDFQVTGEWEASD